MENKDIIPYEEKPIAEIPEEKNDDEEIRIYIPEEKAKREAWVNVFLKYWRFASITVAFAAIFLMIVIVNNPKEAGASAPSDITSTSETTAESIEVVAPPQKEPPMLIDESKIGINADDYISTDYSLSHLQSSKVLIVHSHNSERVSDTVSVSDAGEVISELLNSAGITTLHYTAEHDAEGSIGAYDRMKQSVLQLLKDNPDIALVIDLHDSDSGMPMTLTVGATDEFCWTENLRLAYALYAKTDGIEAAVRLLPKTLGQDTGTLTLNIGISENGTDESAARKLIAQIANALIILFNNNDSR
ncbi:MAG: stage II sporulation protein P [Eubacteriales bacterium]